MASTINASTVSGIVQSADTSGVLALQTGGTSILTGSTGNSLALQGATSGTGCGISFPATQVASSDANTLDDYEEGTWTPSITSSSGSLTSYTSGGEYVKVGQIVYLRGWFKITNAGTASGAATSTGLPFTSSGGGANNYDQVPIVVRETNNTGNLFFGYVNPAATNLNVTTTTNGGITWTNNYTYDFVVTYRASA